MLGNCLAMRFGGRHPVASLPTLQYVVARGANRPPPSAETGQPFQRKLDTESAANWTAVPGETGQSERSDARGGCCLRAAGHLRQSSVELFAGTAPRGPEIEKPVVVAPQASSARGVVGAAQCGQRVTEWGQGGGNAGHGPHRGTDAWWRCPRLVPTVAGDSHALSTRSPPPRALPPPHGPAVTLLGALPGSMGPEPTPAARVSEPFTLRRDSPVRVMGWA